MNATNSSTINATIHRREIRSFSLDRPALCTAPRPVPKAGEILAEVDAVHPFAQVPEAFAHLRRGPFGKAVAQVSAS